MSQNQTTKLRSYRDWRILRDEAIAGASRDIAQFIADNTRDTRSDDPQNPKLFAPGYIQSIEQWLKQI